MWKFLVFMVLLVSVAAQEVTNSSSTQINTQKITNSTQQARQQQPVIAISSKVPISEKTDHSNVVEENIGKGEAKLITSHPIKETTTLDEMNDEENFKYYWMLLVFSSLSIIALIVFKSFRLRRTRAEIKYGKPKEADEIQPLGKSKWDDIDSSENEDEIFDINFLKNTRLNPPSDV